MVQLAPISTHCRPYAHTVSMHYK